MSSRKAAIGQKCNVKAKARWQLKMAANQPSANGETEVSSAFNEALIGMKDSANANGNGSY